MTDYELRVIDDAVPLPMHHRVNEYITHDVTWSCVWKRQEVEHRQSLEYVPGHYPGGEYPFVTQQPRHMFMPRAHFATDEESLKAHAPVYALWKQIDKVLNYEFEIAGNPEGTPASGQPNPSDDDIDSYLNRKEIVLNGLNSYEKYSSPTPTDPDLIPGWRVYANAQPTEHYKNTHGVHRDQSNLSDDRSYTLLFIANEEWYPSWGADNIFYTSGKDDTGDYQQWGGMQKRGYQIDWADNATMVSPKPGRIILYDSRNLHTTRPATMYAPVDRKAIAFRLRKKSG